MIRATQETHLPHRPLCNHTPALMEFLSSCGGTETEPDFVFNELTLVLLIVSVDDSSDSTTRQRARRRERSTSDSALDNADVYSASLHFVQAVR